MPDRAIHIVTGAFGFSGRYIAKRLLEAGMSVRTLTNSMMRENLFGAKIRAYPYSFDKPDKLVDSMRGASVLYNTYWVRFNYPGFSFSTAIENSAKLFEAAGKAGINRIVHISILNASEQSQLEYYRGKALVERRLRESGISHSILRPAVLFGKEDILINNIAYLLRRFPMFNIFGDGSYKLQPIFVDDLARLAVDEGSKTEGRIIDAIRPGNTYLQGIGPDDRKNHRQRKKARQRIAGGRLYDSESPWKDIWRRNNNERGNQRTDDEPVVCGFASGRN